MTESAVTDNLHTPAPWRAEHDDDGHYAIVAGDEIVAEVFYGKDGYDGAALHDATLIAAAPDLLEELEQQADGSSTIIALLKSQHHPVAASLRGMLLMQEQAARAAIAKATQSARQHRGDVE